MTTINDIFRSGFLEKFTAFSTTDTILALAFALGLGLFIFFVYQKTFTGVMYSRSFGISLITMTLLTTLIILAVTSNVALSLGMLGALSMVRFRSAVKEPLDLSFLFWSISAGIVTGAGLFPLAVCGSLFIGGVLMVLVGRKIAENPYILIINCDSDETEKRVAALINNRVKKHLVKSKTVSPSGIELTIDIRLKDDTTDFVNAVAAADGVKSAVLVSYSGEYMA
jgi:uncharacterized membrane protein YhiD involved in acid resistance